MRWVARLAGALVAMLGIAWIALYWWSERILTRQFDYRTDALAIPGDSASLAEGERLATLRGCHGCHGANLGGRVFLDEPNVARIIAPNLTEVLPAYTDRQLTRLLRHGVRNTGASSLAMPIEMLQQLSDADLGMIIAHVRSVPAVHDPLPSREIRLLGRVGLVAGEFPLVATVVNHAEPPFGNVRDTTQAATGEYLARTVCVECHGVDLRGDAGTPSLAQVLGYSRAEFGTLLRTGVPRDARALTLMGTAARTRFVRFRNDEVDALYGFLHALPAVAPANAGPGR
jgi:mono/diheme cytochrome c family protein